MKKKIYLYDASAIFSGKPISSFKGEIITTSLIAEEFQPGGRDYRYFQLLVEQGLSIYDPSKTSIIFISNVIKKCGEQKRISKADTSLLALAYEILESNNQIPVIVTDDYSIQNIANHLHISFKTVSQKGITKRYKWERQCRGCGKKIIEDVDVCPICGSSIKHVIKKSYPVKKQK